MQDFKNRQYANNLTLLHVQSEKTWVQTISDMCEVQLDNVRTHVTDSW